jgi:hypothetical protein
MNKKYSFTHSLTFSLVFLFYHLFILSSSTLFSTFPNFKNIMLLRSYSAPIPSSFLPHSMESSPEQELNRHLPKTLASSRHRNSTPRSNLVRKHHQQQSIVEQETEQKKYKKKTTPSIRELFSSSSLDKQVLDHEEGGKKVRKLQTLVIGGGDMGCDGGRIDGSGRDSGGGGRNGNGWESDYDRDETDAYYQNMIEANPNNSLLLGNYAKFLKEVINLIYLSENGYTFARCG